MALGKKISDHTLVTPIIGDSVPIYRSGSPASDLRISADKLAKPYLGDTAPTTQTISSDTITPTTAFTRLDTEEAAATDDLAAMALDNFPPGALIILRTVDSARNVVLRNAAGGTGELQLAGGDDLTLESSHQHVLLRATSTDWVEVGRFYLPGALATKSSITWGVSDVANGTANHIAGWDSSGNASMIPSSGSAEAEPRSFGATSGTLEIVPDVPKAHYSQINQFGGAITFTKGLSAGATAIGGSFHLISIQPNGDGVSLGAGVVTLHGGALSLVPGVVNWLAFEYHEPSDQLLVAVASSTVSPVFTGLTTVAGVKVASGSSVSGSLTEAAHGGGIFVTSGNVTVPNAAGFSVTLIAGGAHTVGAGGTAHSLASGDVLSVFIPAVGTVRASKVAAANVITLPTS